MYITCAKNKKKQNKKADKVFLSQTFHFKRKEKWQCKKCSFYNVQMIKCSGDFIWSVDGRVNGERVSHTMF